MKTTRMLRGWENVHKLSHCNWLRLVEKVVEVFWTNHQVSECNLEFFKHLIQISLSGQTGCGCIAR